MPTDQQMLNFAVRIAVQSGRIARKYFRSTVPVTSKSTQAFDPVTAADRDIENYLRRKIRGHYPEHGIVGEEQGMTLGKNFTWVIDPIDGTRGFISGSPMWGTLIGLLRGKHPMLGLMHQPVVGETFYADRRGAWWKRGTAVRSLSTRGTGKLENAVLYCTHPDMFGNDLVAYRELESRCQYSRYGGDCYGYCLLAAGFVDLVVEAGLQPYDILPLIPIIESAGGVVTDWQGGKADRGGSVIAAANRKLHKAALSILNP
jgi:myo-inositol-1(or 4)-monophosphatase